MTLSRFTLIAGLALTISIPALAADPVSFREIRLGMTPSELVDLARAKNWSIASYTTVDGRLLTRAIEYRGLPRLDSTTDVVALSFTDNRLGCVHDTTDCAEIDGLNLHFRFGRISAIEILSPLGYARTLKVFAQVAGPMLEKLLGPGDRSPADIEKFFATYNPESAKTGVEIEVGRWTRPEIVNGAPLPISAVLTVFRAFEKYDFYDNKGQAVWPRGICRVMISQTPKDIEEKWVALRKSYADARAASQPAGQ